jgi:hypothetical protein
VLFRSVNAPNAQREFELRTVDHRFALSFKIQRSPTTMNAWPVPTQHPAQK